MNFDPWPIILDNFYKLHTYSFQLLPKNRVAILGSNYDMLKWVDDTLYSWKGVKLDGPAVWQFENKKDAEKFVTLYTLKWAR
jgi:hypothetical protein